MSSWACSGFVIKLGCKTVTSHAYDTMDTMPMPRMTSRAVLLRTNLCHEGLVVLEPAGRMVGVERGLAPPDQLVGDMQVWCP